MGLEEVTGIPPGCLAPEGCHELERGHWGLAGVSSSMGTWGLGPIPGHSKTVPHEDFPGVSSQWLQDPSEPFPSQPIPALSQRPDWRHPGTVPVLHPSDPPLASGTWLCRVSVVVGPVPRATFVPWVQDPSLWLRGFVWVWSSLSPPSMIWCHCPTSVSPSAA